MEIKEKFLLCRCGCRKPVKLGQDGIWNEYLHGHNRKGISPSIEHRKKIADGERGKKQSEEAKKKMSLYWMGRPKPWMQGRKCSKEHIEKNRQLRKQEIQKIKEEGKWEEWVLKRVRKNKSSLENKFQKIIDDFTLPFEYVGTGKFFIGKYIPDFIDKKNKIAIEVYYTYFKKNYKNGIDNYKNDRINEYEKYGWSVLFFDELQIEKTLILSSLKGVFKDE